MSPQEGRGTDSAKLLLLQQVVIVRMMEARVLCVLWELGV